MVPVEIVYMSQTLILRVSPSELYILSEHVHRLTLCLDSKGAFAQYFLREALLNRAARKLFEAWLRKDPTLWARLYATVERHKGDFEHDNALNQDEAGPSDSAPEPAQQAPSTPPEPPRPDDPSLVKVPAKEPVKKTPRKKVATEPVKAAKKTPAVKKTASVEKVSQTSKAVSKAAKSAPKSAKKTVKTAKKTGKS